MRIGPVSEYSGFQTYIKPLSYSVDNSSASSAGYSESVQRNSGKYAVGAARPVMYADSEAVSSGPRKGSDKAREIEQAFNKIASDHYGETTSYGPKGEAFGYEAEGRIFDVFT